MNLRRIELALLGLILLAGAGVRLLYLREARGDPSYRHPAIDAGYNDDWARSIAVPGWQRPAQLPDPEFDTRAYLRPPGYPWFLAATYALSRGSYDAPRLAQLALGLASVLLAWHLGRRAAGAGAGLVFAALAAFHVSLLYWESELLEPTLLVCLLLCALAALAAWSDAPSLARAATAGVTLGACALVRPNALLLLCVAALWMVWIARLRKARLVPSVAALLAAAALTILPATVRNVVVAGDPVLISSNSGINLYIGNNPEATGFVTGTLPGYGDFRTCYDYPAVARKVESELGRKLSDSEISSFFTHKARAFARAQPGRFLALLAKKALLFWGPQEVSHNKVEALDRENSPVLRRLPRGFPPLLAGSLVGLSLVLLSARNGARRELAILVALFTVAWFVSVLPFFAAERYRAPIVPFLMFLCALCAVEVARLYAARRFKPAASWSAAFALLCALASVSPVHLEANVAKWHMDRGRAFQRDGKPELALAEFRSVLAKEPRSAEAHYAAALALGSLGRLDEAIVEYRMVLENRPGDPDALNNLGALYAQRGELEQAIALLARAARAQPANPRYLVNLGHALVLAGRITEAVPLFRETLRLDPGNALAERGLAEAARLQGGSAPNAAPRP